MRVQKPLPPKAMIGLGLLVAGLGAFIVLAAAGVIPAGRMNAPAWVVALAGLVFVLAGVALIAGGLGGATPDGEMPANAPLWARAAAYVLGLVLYASFAMVGSWVAFGPGPRSFAVNIPFLQSGVANEISGRIAFGVGAVLVWLCALAFAVAGWRKLIGRRGG